MHHILIRVVRVPENTSRVSRVLRPVLRSPPKTTKNVRKRAWILGAGWGGVGLLTG